MANYDAQKPITSFVVRQVAICVIVWSQEEEIPRRTAVCIGCCVGWDWCRNCKDSTEGWWWRGRRRWWRWRRCI